MELSHWAALMTKENSLRTFAKNLCEKKQKNNLKFLESGNEIQLFFVFEL